MPVDGGLECLSDEAIADYMSGALAQDARAAVEGHIVRCGTCRQIVADAAFGALVNTEESAAGPPSTVHGAADVEGAAPLAASGCPRTGDVIADKYLVEDFLGSGSMGWVVAARHRDLGLRVAIKVLRSAGPEAARRFLAEAQICARLSHAHIPRVFDIGRLPGGAPYIVMEYLVGRDLAQVAAAGPVPVRDAVRWITQACGALSEAHAAGIIHRDLKPANLFLGAGPGGEAVVKVLDFGISKVATSVADGSADGATATGTSVGSPLYMSPEQIRAHKNVDSRSDIWSLGVILYQLTTGRAPFRGPGLPALAVAIAVDTPPRPSSLRQDLPPRLERIILRCLAKSPDDRYAHVTELVAALASFEDGAPVRRGARHWALGAGLATVFAGAVAVAALLRVSGASTEPEETTDQSSAKATDETGGLGIATPVLPHGPGQPTPAPPAPPAADAPDANASPQPSWDDGNDGAPPPAPPRRTLDRRRLHVRVRPLVPVAVPALVAPPQGHGPPVPAVRSEASGLVGPLDTPD